MEKVTESEQVSDVVLHRSKCNGNIMAKTWLATVLSVSSQLLEFFPDCLNVKLFTSLPLFVAFYDQRDWGLILSKGDKPLPGPHWVVLSGRESMSIISFFFLIELYSFTTRNQEIFGQKLADYALSQGKMTCII